MKAIVSSLVSALSHENHSSCRLPQGGSFRKTTQWLFGLQCKGWRIAVKATAIFKSKATPKRKRRSLGPDQGGTRQRRGLGLLAEYRAYSIGLSSRRSPRGVPLRLLDQHIGHSPPRSSIVRWYLSDGVGLMGLCSPCKERLWQGPSRTAYMSARAQSHFLSL